MYAVIFSSTLSGDVAGYQQTAARMVKLCSQQEGFVGIDSVRGDDGHGITVCLWESLDAIAAWRADLEHLAAQQQGIDRWYSEYRLIVCEVIDGA